MKRIALPAALTLLVSMLTPGLLRGATAAEASETAPASDLSSAELAPGPAAVIGRNVNVRAQPTINSEVVIQLQDGDVVTVEDVLLRSANKSPDPVRWAQITYPAAAQAWVHSSFINAPDQTVRPRTLNVRSGPGENFTVVGTLKAGDAVAPTGARGEWISIQPPKGARAYVAAKLLRQVTPVTAVAATPPVAEPATEVPDAPAVLEGAAPDQPHVPQTALTTPEVDVPASAWDPATEPQRQDVITFAPLPETDPLATVDPEEPPPPRIVQREGVVRGFTSIQAPSHFRLVSPDTGRNINYLHTTSTNLDLSRYVGLHIIATGEEYLDHRWPNTPVLTLRRIVVLD